MENSANINSVSKKTDTGKLPKTKRSRIPIPTPRAEDKKHVSVRRVYILHEEEIKILFQKYAKRPSKIPVRVKKNPPVKTVQQPEEIKDVTEKTPTPVKKTYRYIAYTIKGNGDIVNIIPPEMKDSDIFTPDKELNLNTEAEQPTDVPTNASRNGFRKRMGRVWKSFKKLFTCGCCYKTGERD